MPKPSTLKLRAKKAAQARWTASAAVLDATRLAFSVIVEGLEPEKTFRAMLWNDLEIKSYTEVYAAMKTVCSEIKEMAGESMAQVRESLPENSIVGFDGSWEHRRNSLRCLFSVVSPKTGQVLHSVMSRIRSKEDIKEALERSLLDGDIGSGDFPEYMKEITEAVLSVESYGWFTGKYDVLNEIEIVEPGGKISRPDRVLVSGNSAVVVDYKFGAPEKRYEKQVSRYMGLLGAMGYGNVKGYLWYVDEGRVSEVL